MTLFQFKWLRRFVRRNTTPISHDVAHVWRRRLSVLYMLIAWQAFGIVGYMMYTGKSDWVKYYGYKSDMESKLTPAQQFAKTMNIENAKIVRFAGFQKIGEEHINSEDK